MANSSSSRKKPSKKAATRSRSTTSSTTGRTKRTKKKQAAKKTTKNQTEAAEKTNDNKDTTTANKTAPIRLQEPGQEAAPLLTPQQQDLFLQFLARGASPAGACQQLGVSLASVEETFSEAGSFLEGLEKVHAVLSQNVAAALYREAMNGNVTAQKFWLEKRPPPDWNQTVKHPHEPNAMQELTDEELIEAARQEGVDLPPELENSAEQTGR